MKVAHVGNIQQNGYNNAKAQRLYSTIEAYSFDPGGGPSWVHPAWEDGEFNLLEVGTDNWDWENTEIVNGWKRPNWAYIFGNENAKAYYKTQAEYQRDLPRLLKGALNNRGEWGGMTISPTKLMRLNEDDKDFGVIAANFRYNAFRANLTERLSEEGFDVIVWNGGEDCNILTTPRSTVSIAFDHGGLRSIPNKDNISKVIACKSVLEADGVMLTNGDTVFAARELGLEDYRFMPHPVDIHKYMYRSLSDTENVRKMLCSGTKEREEAELIFFAPARHEFSREDKGIKANYKILQAFHRYTLNKSLPKAVLVFIGWGHDVVKAMELTTRLGIHKSTIWTQPAHKELLKHLYWISDLVLDQFSGLGSFGTITVESLASSTPVITNIKKENYEWCEDVLPMPPILQAFEADEIYENMKMLAQSKDLRSKWGELGTNWAQEKHSLAYVAQLHEDYYKHLLERVN